MKNKTKNNHSGFTNEFSPKSCHVCLIYENEEQRKKVVSQYIAEGLQKGEAVRYFFDRTSPENIRSWLIETGIEISEAEKKEMFAISPAENAYYPEGSFEPKAMIDRSVRRYDILKNAGYSGFRACGEMSWALKNIPGSDQILEYELLLNSVETAFPHSGMCQYNAHLFDGATLFKILQVHPYIIAQGQVVYNPYYIKPVE